MESYKLVHNINKRRVNHEADYGSMSVKASPLLHLCNLYTSFHQDFMGEGGIDDFRDRESVEYLIPKMTLDYWALSGWCCFETSDKWCFSSL